MKEIKFEHTFACDVDSFWNRMFFDQAFNHALFREHLGFLAWDVKVEQDTDEVRKQTVTVKPPVADIPAAVKKVMGDNFGYAEHGTFDKRTKRYAVKVEPNVAKDKTTVQGEIWVEKVDDTHCRRFAKFSIEVKIMMLGKLIEDRIAEDMSQSFEKGAAFTHSWIEQGKLG